MSTVELTRETDGPGLLQALADHGLAGELIDDAAHLTVEVEDCDEERLATRSRTGSPRVPAARPGQSRRLHVRGVSTCG